MRVIPGAQLQQHISTATATALRVIYLRRGASFTEARDLSSSPHAVVDSGCLTHGRRIDALRAPGLVVWRRFHLRFRVLSAGNVSGLSSYAKYI